MWHAPADPNGIFRPQALSGGEQQHEQLGEDLARVLHQSTLGI